MWSLTVAPFILWLVVFLCYLIFFSILTIIHLFRLTHRHLRKENIWLLERRNLFVLLKDPKDKTITTLLPSLNVFFYIVYNFFSEENVVLCVSAAY